MEKDAENDCLWTQQYCCTHELTRVVAAYPRPAQYQVSQHCSLGVTGSDEYGKIENFLQKGVVPDNMHMPQWLTLHPHIYIQC